MTSVLETWMAEEAQVMATLAAGPGEGVATREQIAGKTGLEAMQAILRGELPTAPIGKSMNFCLVHLEEGKTIFQGTPKPAFFNPLVPFMVVGLRPC